MSVHCAFCFGAADLAPDGDALRLTIRRDGHEAEQEVYAHGRCLRDGLDPRVPFLLSVFGEDWTGEQGAA